MQSVSDRKKKEAQTCRQVFQTVVIPDEMQRADINDSWSALGVRCCRSSPPPHPRSMLTCCNKDGYGYNHNDNGINGLLDNLQVGVCEFTENYFDSEVTVTEPAQKVGTFKAVW